MSNCHSWPLDVSSNVNCLFQMGSHYIHSSANQWSAVTGSFKWGIHHLTVLNGLSLQTFISQSVICCKWQFEMGGGHCPKKVCLPNLNSFWVFLLLHRGLFYKRPISLSLMHLYSTYLTLLWAFLSHLTFSEALCGYASLNKCVFNCFLNKSKVAAFW